MSFVHYLTVGRFGFTEGSVPPGLMDRVVAHFVRGGLRQLGRPTSFVVPWNEGELAELEEVVNQRYQLGLDLRDYLNGQGLLCMQYTGVPVHFAYPVALVAHELFAASAGEHGEIYDPGRVRALAEEHAAENEQRRRVNQVRDGAERLRLLIEALRVDAEFMPPWLAQRSIADVAATIVPELIDLLAYQNNEIAPLQNQRIRSLAVAGLSSAGPAAVSAVPALTALLRESKTDSLLAFEICLALAAMGQGAEPGLAAALDLGHEVPWARKVALEALAKLDSLTEATRTKLEAMAQGEGELAGLAKHALGQSPIAKRLRSLRQAFEALDPAVQGRAITERLKEGELDHAQVRFAGYLGDPACQIAVHGTRAKAVDDLSAWIEGLPDAPVEWLVPVIAAALDARSAFLPPRSAALTQAVAQTLREGTASPEKLQDLFQAHEWLDIPGLDYHLLHGGVEAAGKTGAELRQHLHQLTGSLTGAAERAVFFLLLGEEAIPRVLAARS